MSRINPVEGDHYIFDRYAFLGLDASVPKGEISAAITQKYAGLHPDRLIKVDAELARNADHLRGLTDKCAAILLNDELRPLYDQRLEWFHQNQPEMISTDGHPIIAMGKESFDLDFLLSKDKPAVKAMVEKVTGMSGYSPKNLELFEKLYRDNNDGVADAYHDALEAKLIYLTLMEDIAWGQVGISAFKPKTANYLRDQDGYVDLIEQELDLRRASIADAVGNRNEAIRIGMARPPLLLADMREDALPATGEGMRDEDIEKLTAAAQQLFIDSAQWIRDLAKQKQEVIQKLVSVTRIEELDIPVDPTQPYYLHVVRVIEEGAEPVQLTSFVVLPELCLTQSEEDVFANMTKSELRETGCQGSLVFYDVELKQVVLQVQRAADVYIDRYHPEPEEANQVEMPGVSASSPSP